MGTQGNKLYWLRTLAVTAAVAVGSGPALADQTSAQHDASQTHNNGSHNSLNESYGNALHAVSNFYDMDIPGAITYGLKAYGQYRNSNQMDNLRDRNNQLAFSMATAGSSGTAADGGGAPVPAGASAADPSGITGSTAATHISPYAGCETQFLHDGDTADIAAKVEQITGMPRDQMFQLFTSVQATARGPYDADFVPWAKKTYNDVSAKFPNADFRAKLDTMGDMVAAAAATGLTQSWIAKMKAVDGPGGPGTMVAQKTDAPAASSDVAPVAAAAATAPTAAAEGDRAPAAAQDETGLSESLRFTNRGSAATGMDHSLTGLDHLGTQPVDGFLGDLMKQKADDAPSLFQAVSNKIKEVTVRQHLDRRAVVASVGAQ